MHLRLTAKLAIVFAIIGILASGLTGYYAYTSNQKMLIKEAGSSLTSSSDLLGRRFTSTLNDIADDTRVLALLPNVPELAQQLRSANSTEAQALATIFSRFISVHKEYLQICLISAGTNGQEVVRVDQDTDKPVWIQPSRLQEKGHFPYVFETLKLPPKHIYISPITTNHEHGAHYANGRSALRVATPIANSNGVVVGVLAINVDLQGILRPLQQDLPHDYTLYLANQWGDFLVHPDQNQTLGFGMGRHYQMQNTFPGSKPLFDSYHSSSSTDTSTSPPSIAAGSLLVFMRKPLSPPEGHQFVMIGLSRPLQDVLSGGILLGKSIIQMVLAFSALSIILAIFFSQALTKPLKMLAHAATSFSSRRSMAQLPLHRKDEIGVLAQCFDQMRKEINTQIEYLHDKQQELTYLARHDTLTNLPNRMLFFHYLDNAVEEAANHNKQLAVLFVDLDHFKQVNDLHGHAIGDQVLITVANRLRQEVGDNDVVARLAGDEFVVLIERLDSPDDIRPLAQAILDSMNSPLTITGHTIQVGASIGISLFPRNGTSAEELVLRADEAMYRAKSSGRHTFDLCF